MVSVTELYTYHKAAWTSFSFNSLKCASDSAWQEPRAAILFIPLLVYFRARSDVFKALGVCFSSDPTGPVGMMYARTGMPTMNTLNHHGLVQIGLMRTIWTTVSQTLAQMNGIPFHTRRRTLIFRSSRFPPSSTSVTLFHKSLLQTSPPPLHLCCFLRNINPILSWLRLKLLLLTLR